MAPNEGLTRFICLFHKADRAASAVAALEQLGISRSSISTLRSDNNDDKGSGDAQSLTAMGLPERDLRHLQDGLRHGGSVVSLEAQEKRSDEIERIFKKFNADKIDEADRETDVAPVAAPYVAEPAVAATGQTVIPIAQESLTVGKREVDRGGVRVYRHTVEEPVSESVNLHEEHVVVNRRPVNRAVTDADVTAGNREIELVETAEVPVVQKVARVVEEVHVGKVGTEHTETIHDSVRHTEIEVEQIGTDDVRPGSRRN